MFGIDPTVMMFIALATLAVGGVSYAFLYDRLATERRSGERLERIKSEIVAAENGTGVKIKRTRTAPANGKKDVTERRKKLEETLKSADKRKDVQDLYIKKPPLDIQIMQAGMDIPLRKFYINSILFGAGLAIVAVILGASLLMAPVLFIVGAFGLPRWWVKRKRNKRIAAFLAEFPNAIDVIVRAVKSGLPLNDGIKLIANESAEPVRTEFRRIIDAQSIGKSTPQACLEMQRTMPCAEAAFFGIVIQIQSQAGGNLSEALGNLSRVLRDR